MDASFFSLQFYFGLNIAIAVGYLLVFSLCYFSKNVNHLQRLRFCRVSLCMVICLFLIMPFIVDIFNIPIMQNQLSFEPLLKMAGNGFDFKKSIVNDISINQNKDVAVISFNSIIITGLLLGFSAMIIGYLINIYKLLVIKNRAYCKYKIHNIHILFDSEAVTPFCWSFLSQHYIVLPQYLLEDKTALKLSLQHEFQHIRQGDTIWVHLLAFIKIFCFANPFVYQWIRLIHEYQEFSCDEQLVLRKKITAFEYANCLVKTAGIALARPFNTQLVLGIQGFNKSILTRRINMIFSYHKRPAKKLTVFSSYLITFFAATSIAFAANDPVNSQHFSVEQISAMMDKSSTSNDFKLSVTPEVVSTINSIISNKEDKRKIEASLERMKQYQAHIQNALNDQNMPGLLQAIPLVESGYQPLDESKNPVKAAGIWQIIPETGKRYGLKISKAQDERLDTTQSTKAALAFLKDLHQQFQDWNLTVIGYEIGENKTAELIQKTGSKDLWKIANSEFAPKGLKDFMVRFQAMSIIMQNPDLLTQKG